MQKKINYIFSENKEELFGAFLAGFGTIWLFIEFASALFNPSKVFFENYNWWVLSLSIAASITFSFWYTWPTTKITRKFKSSNTEICIKTGDLFSQPHNIVVTSSDYFDTTIPQGTKVSLKAQMIDKFFSNNIQTLDNLIQKSLQDQGINGIYNSSKKGKKLKFPIGSTAIIPIQQNRIFITILAELSFINNTKHISSDPEKLNISLTQLWKCVRAEGRMKEVSLPVLGTGLSGINLSSLMIIESIILSYAIHSKSKRICDKLTIMIPENKYDPKDFHEVCKFLASIQI